MRRVDFGTHSYPVSFANCWINIGEGISSSAMGCRSSEGPVVLWRCKKTKFGKRVRNTIVIATISALVLLPSVVYLATVAAAAFAAVNVAPLYCNNAGGCPWTY